MQRISTIIDRALFRVYRPILKWLCSATGWDNYIISMIVAGAWFLVVVGSSAHLSFGNQSQRHSVPTYSLDIVFSGVFLLILLRAAQIGHQGLVNNPSNPTRVPVDLPFVRFVFVSVTIMLLASSIGSDLSATEFASYLLLVTYAYFMSLPQRPIHSSVVNWLRSVAPTRVTPRHS